MSIFVESDGDGSRNEYEPFGKLIINIGNRTENQNIEIWNHSKKKKPLKIQVNSWFNVTKPKQLKKV